MPHISNTTCDKTPRIISPIFYADASLNFQTHHGLLMNMLAYWAISCIAQKMTNEQQRLQQGVWCEIWWLWRSELVTNLTFTWANQWGHSSRLSAHVWMFIMLPCLDCIDGDNFWPDTAVVSSSSPDYDCMISEERCVDEFSTYLSCFVRPLNEGHLNIRIWSEDLHYLS